MENKTETKYIVCPDCNGSPYSGCEGDIPCEDNPHIKSCKGCRYECETCHGEGKIKVTVRKRKVLSVKNPWGYLLCLNIKPVENRTWSNDYRGELLIHASKMWDKDAEFTLDQWVLIPEAIRDRILDRDLPTGAIIGKVNLRDIVTDSPSIWAVPSLKHWVCADGELFDDPIPAKGQLGLWEYEDTNVT